MKRVNKKWYTISRTDKGYVVWCNTFKTNSDGTIGAGGCRGIFKGTRQECINYCKENKIKVKR